MYTLTITYRGNRSETRSFEDLFVAHKAYDTQTGNAMVNVLLLTDADGFIVRTSGLRERSVVTLKGRRDFYRVTKVDGDTALVEPVAGGRAIRRLLTDLAPNEYQRGYLDGLDYGKRHMGFGADYAEHQSLDYQEGYEVGYDDAHNH